MNRYLFVIILMGLIARVYSQSEKTPQSTELWEPVPTAVMPGNGTEPPSDAIVLFDGKNLDEWTSIEGGPAMWTLGEGCMTVKPKSGDIVTKRSFGDCQLHIEWRSPTDTSQKGQIRGNSGIFLQKRYELQILDSYKNQTYSNGQAGSMYKQAIPLVNVCRKPGEWQSYDIIFQAPRFSDNGRIAIPAHITVLHNGVLILNHVEIQGSTAYIGPVSYTMHCMKEPLSLQDHGDRVSYRNIWIREL